YFFFSSRRRHTRWPRDWSSDVCSSDLHLVAETVGHPESRREILFAGIPVLLRQAADPGKLQPSADGRPIGQGGRSSEVEIRNLRSEERRVGKECRSGWWRDD